MLQPHKIYCLYRNLVTKDKVSDSSFCSIALTFPEKPKLLHCCRPEPPGNITTSKCLRLRFGGIWSTHHTSKRFSGSHCNKRTISLVELKLVPSPEKIKIRIFRFIVLVAFQFFLFFCVFVESTITT